MDVFEYDEINKGFNEAIQLIKLNHKNIVKVYNVFLIAQSKLCIEMEYLQYGTLSNLIKQKIRLPEKFIIKILQQCCNALQYLEENEIIHRDIKLDNILIKNVIKEEIEIILIDFGLIKLQNSTFSMSQIVGTDGYLALELKENENYIPYSYKSDLFALGVVFYKLMSFDCISDIALLYHYDNNDERVKDGLIKNIKRNYNYSCALINLILKLLERDVINRPNAKQILDEIILIENNNDISFSNEFINCGTFESKIIENGKLTYLTDIKIDEKDNLIFVVECYYHRIQVFDFNGIFQYEIKTPYYPCSVAIDYFRNGTEILVGGGNDQKIYRFEKNENGKQLNEVIGTGHGSGDNEFNFILGGIIIDEINGNIYISDDNNNRIKVYSNSGQLLKIITNNELIMPCKLDFNSKKQLVISDIIKNAIQIFDLDGNLISTIKHENYTERALGLVVDKTNDNIYISNYSGHCISVFNKDGQFIKSFGTKGKGIGEFKYIEALAINSNGQLYVVDCENYRIQIINNTFH